MSREVAPDGRKIGQTGSYHGTDRVCSPKAAEKPRLPEPRLLGRMRASAGECVCVSVCVSVCVREKERIIEKEDTSACRAN